MKKLIALAAFATLNVATIFGQCTSLFSFSAYFENVTFINQSNIPNAHYFWNFGDGTGSNFENPAHKFPETGNYLVTLFAKDTISNCSSYYEYWVDVNKYSSDVCQTTITDSIFIYNSDYYLKIIDNSSNCNGYSSSYDAGPASNFPPNNWIWLGGGWSNAKFVSRVQYYTYDTLNGYVVHREAYKTTPFLYTSSKNYGDCSANFEFNVVSKDSGGQTILFKAMNSNATSYEWEIMGFGNPIITNNDTISKYYPYGPNDIWAVGLKTSGISGCKDTLYQAIIVKDIIQTTANVSDIQNDVYYDIYPNPTNGKLTIENRELKIENVSVYNMLGERVYQSNTNQQQTTIDLSSQPAGIYFIEIKSENEKVFKKIIKE